MLYCVLGANDVIQLLAGVVGCRGNTMQHALDMTEHFGGLQAANVLLSAKCKDCWAQRGAGLGALTAQCGCGAGT